MGGVEGVVVWLHGGYGECRAKEECCERGGCWRGVEWGVGRGFRCMMWEAERGVVVECRSESTLCGRSERG